MAITASSRDRNRRVYSAGLKQSVEGGGAYRRGEAPTRTQVDRFCHPGEILDHEFLRPLKLTVASVARRTGVRVGTLHYLLKRRGRITPQIDIRLCRFFGLSQGYWLRLQLEFDLCVARAVWGKRVAKEVDPLQDDLSRRTSEPLLPTKRAAM